MFARLTRMSILGAALVAAMQGSAAHAVYAPTVSDQVRPVNGAGIGATTIGACQFLASGPSTNPNWTPFHIEGNAVYVGARVAASTELSCQLRKGLTTVVGTVTLQLPGNTTAVAGSIPVSSLGSFYICTMVNVHFTDGGESNPAEDYACRPIISI